MSKKLLKEETIRRFMKLADLKPLSSGFIENLDESGGKAGRIDRQDIANKASGRWLKEGEEEETLEEQGSGSPQGSKEACEAAGGKWEHDDETGFERCSGAPTNGELLEEEGTDEPNGPDEVNENWFKGSKDDLLFERLKEKWCK